MPASLRQRIAAPFSPLLSPPTLVPRDSRRERVLAADAQPEDEAPRDELEVHVLHRVGRVAGAGAVHLYGARLDGHAVGDGEAGRRGRRAEAPEDDEHGCDDERPLAAEAAQGRRQWQWAMRGEEVQRNDAPLPSLTGPLRTQSRAVQERCR